MTAPKALESSGLLSTGDVAERCQVHRTTVWHWIKSGRLRTTPVTPRFSGVSEEELKRFQDEFIGGSSEAAVSPKKVVTSKAKVAKTNGVKAKPRKR